MQMGRTALLFRRWCDYAITGHEPTSLLHLSSFAHTHSRALRSGWAIIGSWSLRSTELDVEEGRLPRLIARQVGTVTVCVFCQT